MLKKRGKTEEEIEAIIEKEFANATGICTCVAASFRAALLGIKNVWGDEVPKRDDIRIISNLPTPGSCQCFQYITGNAPNVKAVRKSEFHIILPNGTEVKNLSMKNLKKIAMNINASYYNFIICRTSTGECFTANVKDDVFSGRLLRSEKEGKVWNSREGKQKEIEKFRKEWEDLRNKFLTQPEGIV